MFNKVLKAITNTFIYSNIYIKDVNNLLTT